MKRRRKALVALAMGIGLASRAWADEDHWTFNGDGSWSDASNWDVGVPAAGVNVLIDHNDSINRSITYDFTGGPIQLGSLTINNTGSGSNVFSQSANGITVFSEYVGSTGAGYWSLGGGTHQVNGSWLQFGSMAGSTGIGTVGGGTLDAATQWIILGYSGAGMVTQSSGAVLSRQLYAGFSADGAGTYNLGGGTISAGSSEFIGLVGRGAFNQSGGTNTVGADVYFGYSSAASIGSYSLTGGMLKVNRTEFVGYNGAGTLTQSGGTNSIAGHLELAYLNPSSSGTYLLGGSGYLNVAGYETVGYSGPARFEQSGGTNLVGVNLTVGNESTSASTFLLSGGTLSVNQYELVGERGNGTFNQSGGLNTVATPAAPFGLNIGDELGSFGTYLLSGGTLNVNGYAQVGFAGAGTLIQSGGVHNVSENVQLGFTAGGRGNYLLSNGVLNVTDYELIGYGSDGTFSQSGGINTVGINFHLGYSAAGSGSYLLSGGTLNVSGYDEVGFDGAGTMIQSGGTHNVALNVQLGFDPGSRGTYVLKDIGVLKVTNFELIGYGSNGTFIQSGGTQTVGQNLHVGWGTAGIGTYLLSGGQVNTTGHEFVGFDGVGTFNQSGGTNSIGKTSAVRDLYLGYEATGLGTYLMSGGVLSTTGADVIGFSGTGTFNQSGGTHLVGTTSATGNLYIGYHPSVSGYFALSNTGSFNVSGVEYVGYSGAGTFDQSGGTHTIGSASRYFYIGYDFGGMGRYLLSGGLLSARGNEYVGYGGDGTMNQSGGTHTIANSLNIGVSSGGSGTYLFSGGTLVAGTVFSNALFSQSGGIATFGNFDSGLARAGAGTAILSGGRLFANRIRQYSLSISGSGSATISAKATANSSAGISIVKSLAISPGGQLDLSNNGMIIDYDPPAAQLIGGSILTDVRDDLLAGRLTSSLADATHALGYADNAVLNLATFGGVVVDSTSVLIKFVIPGDANLDDQLDTADLDALAAHWHVSANWTEGDFDYSGFVDESDELKLIPTWPGGVDSLNAALVARGLPPAPEPIGWAISLPAMALLLARRRP